MEEGEEGRGEDISASSQSEEGRGSRTKEGREMAFPHRENIIRNELFHTARTPSYFSMINLFEKDKKERRGEEKRREKKRREEKRREYHLEGSNDRALGAWIASMGVPSPGTSQKQIKENRREEKRREGEGRGEV